MKKTSSLFVIIATAVILASCTADKGVQRISGSLEIVPSESPQASGQSEGNKGVPNNDGSTDEAPSSEQPREQILPRLLGLTTNTANISIPFDEILSGGPGKDGIPSIDSPVFLSQGEAEDAMNYLDANDEGVVVRVGNDVRFYSFDILVWHEIVNDVVGGKPLAVTFCPLCWSSIVYDREVDGEVHEFGVSGLLYNSNLLMYDRTTESLWSQSLGEAVVGDFLGTELVIYTSDILTYGEFIDQYPSGVVLSDDTGHFRTYSQQPYGGYLDTERLYFPVNNTNVDLPAKELLYIVNDGDISVGFVRNDLRVAGSARIGVNGNEYVATYENGRIEVKQGDRLLPGFHELWFSWMASGSEGKYLWQE